MRAVLLEKFGEPTHLRVKELDKPRPRPGEVLVAVRAASINPSDVANVAGKFSATKLPRIPGRDFAGVVAAGPKEWMGAEVFGTGGDLGISREGTHADFVAVPAEAVVRKPARLSMDEAACIGVNFVTAFSALTMANLIAGETLLVIGAGGVGGAALQLARWWKALSIAVVRDAADVETAKQLGAAEVIVNAQQALPEAVKGLTREKGAAVAFDTVGGPMFEPTLMSVAEGGRHVVIAANGETRVSFDLKEFYRRRLRLYGLNTAHFSAVDCAERLRSLVEGFATGALRPARITETYDLADAVKAYGRVASKAVKGKVVLRMG